MLVGRDQNLYISLILTLILHQTSTQQHTLASEISSLYTHRHHICNLLRRAQPADRNIAHIASSARHGLLIRDQACVSNHGRGNIIYGNPLSSMLPGQIPHHALQTSLGRRVVAPVDTASVRCQTANENDPAPLVGLHVRNRQLAQNEARTQVDRERIVKLINGNVQDVGNPLSVPSIGDEDVWAVLSVLGLDLGKEALDVIRRGHVCLVSGHFGRGPLRKLLKLGDECVYGVLIPRVGQGQ